MDVAPWLEASTSAIALELVIRDLRALILQPAHQGIAMAGFALFLPVDAISATAGRLVLQALHATEVGISIKPVYLNTLSSQYFKRRSSLCLFV